MVSQLGATCTTMSFMAAHSGAHSGSDSTRFLSASSMSSDGKSSARAESGKSNISARRPANIGLLAKGAPRRRRGRRRIDQAKTSGRRTAAPASTRDSQGGTRYRRTCRSLFTGPAKENVALRHVGVRPGNPSPVCTTIDGSYSAAFSVGDRGRKALTDRYAEAAGESLGPFKP